SLPALEVSIEQTRRGKPVPPLSVTLVESGKQLECRLLPRVNQQHDITAIVLWFYDVSDQQQSYFRLQQENEKLKSEIQHYSTILNMAPYPIWQRDADLQLRFYNLSYSEAVEDV